MPQNTQYLPDTYQRGDFVPVGWQALGVSGAASVILQVKQHTLDISSLMIDVTNTGFGGVRGRIAGLRDMDGSAELSLDLGQVPWLSPYFVLDGVSGIMTFGYSANAGIQVPCIVEKTHHVSGVDKEVQWSCTVKGNALAGVLVYQPVA